MLQLVSSYYLLHINLIYRYGNLDLNNNIV